MTGIDNVDLYRLLPSRLLRNALSRADGKCYTPDRHPPLPQPTLGMSGWQLLSVHASIIASVIARASSCRAQAVVAVAVCGSWRLGLELLFRFYFLKRGGRGCTVAGVSAMADTPVLCAKPFFKNFEVSSLFAYVFGSISGIVL